ncbi:MAG TPA: hypothetical protein P5052_03920 [Candidatus Paceibacterota bacterium]|jgi:hypothetical protein|nr:hypothetical protein [Candidatus Paceibacterota bacterium]HRZ29860.1 hypothetical protein [Candidatus Paceibacterota bacterium]
MVCISDLDYNFNGSYCNSYNIVWNGEKWSKSFDISHIPFSSEKVYFVVRAINQEYELQSEFSDVVDADIYEMPKRIDEYISNVN